MDQDRVRARIKLAIQALDAGEKARAGQGETVELDQARTGRLSRMDALAAQQMAMAGQRRAQQQRQRLRAALKRLDEGDYGYCRDCDEPIPEGRLMADPAATLCVGCASAREQSQ